MRTHVAASLWHLHELRRAMEERRNGILVGVVTGAIKAIETLGELSLEDTQH
jgi:hypothetical protein